MAGWFTSSTAFDEQIEKATSSGLEDMAANLEICDMIRSKAVGPKEAMRSLKKRIGNKNPNIQLSALQLTDACVKNGGSHFLSEIASREFIDNLVSLMKAPNGINNDVKIRILELIQAWASAFEGRSNLSHVNETYRLLRSDGYNFPPAPKVSSSFIDSSAPPEWADSDVCMRCRTAFTMMNRKHHCRNCGNVFDQTCSSNNLPLPHLGIVQPVRVCDGCHVKLTEKKMNISRPIPQQMPSRYQQSSSIMQPRNPRVEDDGMDEDLKMALKMSLEESQGGRSAGYVSQSQLKVQTPARSSSKKQAKVEDDEDDELKAAIAASLADMEVQKKKSAWQNPTAAAAAAASQPQGVAPIRSDFELTPTEAENINLFSTFVDRLQSQPPGTILREPGIQELYESMNKLRPKLARTFGETMSKYEALCELHDKLSTVVRYYDKMLEERLSYSYNRHNLGGSGAHYNRPSSTYASAPQNAESYYGANFRSPPPSTVQPHRPGSIYQQPSTPGSQYPPLQQQYARPQSVVSNSAPSQEINQKYNMYPSMPTPVNQAPPSPYPPVNTPGSSYPPPLQHQEQQQHQQPGYIAPQNAFSPPPEIPQPTYFQNAQQYQPAPQPQYPPTSHEPPQQHQQQHPPSHEQAPHSPQLQRQASYPAPAGPQWQYPPPQQQADTASYTTAPPHDQTSHEQQYQQQYQPPPQHVHQPQFQQPTQQPPTQPNGQIDGYKSYAQQIPLQPSVVENSVPQHKPPAEELSLIDL